MNLFSANSSIYKWDADLPTKIIFIREHGLERFLQSVGLNPYGYVPAPHTSKSVNTTTPRPLPVSLRKYIKHDSEQRIILVPISDSNLKSDIPRENLARNYAVETFDLFRGEILGEGKIFGQKFLVQKPPLFDVFSSSESHFFIGFSGNGFLSDKKNLTTGRFGITDKTIEIRKYNIAGEYEIMFFSKNYKDRLNASPPGLERSELRTQLIDEIKTRYFLKPFLDLGYILENNLQAPKTNPEPKDIEKYLTYRREISDFSYYCMFGPNLKTRGAFDKLLLWSAKHPINETVFKKYFGASYAQFYTEMYSFYRAIGNSDPKFKKSEWGPNVIIVSRFTKKDLPPEASFTSARRNQSARIIADWFTVNRVGVMASDILHKAEEDAPWVLTDPEFDATLGLNEAKFGDKTKALRLLERASAAKIARPEVYRVISKLQLDDILNRKGANYKLQEPEFHDVLAPLETAMQQPQPNPQTYLQLMNLADHAGTKPAKEFVEKIAKDCGTLLPDNFPLLDKLVPWLKNHGYSELATGLLEKTGKCVLSDREIKHLQDLRKSLDDAVSKK